MPKQNTESNKEATNSPLLSTIKDGQVPGPLFPYVIGRASHSMQNNTFGTWLKRVSHGAKNNSWHKFTQTRNVNFQFSGFSHFSLDISLVHLFVMKSFLLIFSDLRMLVLLMLLLVCQLFSLLYYQITAKHFIGHLQNKLTHTQYKKFYFCISRETACAIFGVTSLFLGVSCQVLGHHCRLVMSKY